MLAQRAPARKAPAQADAVDNTEDKHSDNEAAEANEEQEEQTHGTNSLLQLGAEYAESGSSSPDDEPSPKKEGQGRWLSLPVPLRS